MTMESETDDISSNSSVSMVEDSDEFSPDINTLATDINGIELYVEDNLKDGSLVSSFPYLSAISSGDTSPILSGTSEVFFESSNSQKSGSGSEKSTHTNSKQPFLKRTYSNNSFNSTKAPNKKYKDEKEKKIKSEKKEVDVSEAFTSIQEAKLEKLCQPFEQYLKEQQIALINSRQKQPQLKRDPDSKFVSLKDLPLLTKPWMPVNNPARKFKSLVLPLPAEHDEANNAVYYTVMVTAVQDPAHVYVTLVDDECFRFEQVAEEMQRELEKNAIPEIPGKWIGHICAVNINNHWYRVLVEEEDSSDRVDVFFVDNGRRLGVRKSSCYFLPDRFLDIPAQALRCVLNGIQPANSDEHETSDANSWNWQVITYLQRQRQKKGIVLIEQLSLGQVGRLPKTKEFAAHCILHIYGEDVSVNRWLCDNDHAITDNPIDIPDLKKRRSLTGEDLVLTRGTTEAEEDNISVTSSNSRRTTQASSSPSVAEERVSVWYEMGDYSGNQGFFDGTLYQRDALQKRSGNPIIVPSGMNSSKLFHEKPLSNSRRKLSSTKSVDETTIGPLTFSWCESPYAIYLQTTEMLEKLIVLIEEMGRHYQDSKPTGSKYYEVGFRCAVFCKGYWWRAMLLNNDAFPDCEVILTDRGVRRKVNASQIRSLDAKFQEYGKLVLRVSLRDVFPSSGKVWGSEVKRFLRERLLDGDDIKFCYRKNEQMSNEYSSGIIVYTYELEEGPVQIGGLARINLNDELVSLDLASRKPCSPNYEPKPTSWKPPIYPNPGERFWAKVTWVNMDGEIYLHDVRAEEKLEEITRQLTKFFANTQPTKEDINPRLGEMCVAKYTDGNWYRCVVKELKRDEGNAILNYEDYGTRDATSLCNIRLNTTLEDIPIQGWRCKLHNVRPIGDSWDWDTLTSIHKLIVEHEFTCDVIGKHPVLTVALSKHGKLLADELVEKSLVTYEKIPYGKKNKKSKIEVIDIEDDITAEVINLEDNDC